MDADDRPLVLTLRLDDQTQARFDRERAALFPGGVRRWGRT
jgi:hypothetical protein